MASDGGAGDVDEGWRSSARSLPNSTPMAAPPQMQLQMYSSSPLVDPDRSGYGSRAGGKLRALRKTGRRNTNPYERPAVGRHASAGPQAAVLISNGGVTAAQALAEKKRGAWLTTGLTKIITTSATYLYSSIFKRRLPAPVQVSNDVEEPASAEEQVSSPSAEANDAEAVSRSEGENEEHAEVQEPTNNTLTDVERLLQKKTLSGDEYERLSALLRSRVVNNSAERKKQGSQVDRASHQENQPAAGIQAEAQRWRQDLQKSREERENGVRTLTVYENGTPSSAVATTAAGAESMDGLSGSPIDVAIAFMGRRVIRQPGSTPPAEPLNRRDENLPSGGPPSLVMSQATLSKWAPPDFGDDEQFRTPAPPSAQTRSRFQGYLRTPYSRPQRLQPSRERALDGSFGTPLSARWTPIRTPVTGGREMLKRRSTVLDDSYASVGPMRRTRQKAFMSPVPTSTRASALPPPSTSGSAIMTLPSSQAGKFAGPAARQRPCSMTGQEKTALTVSGTSYVPAQSSETARKILETLEKMTPSPKGKSLEEELSFVRDRPPATLTENMLNEQARKSMTVVDFSLPSVDSREPGPSGRTRDYESPSLRQYESGSKSSELAAKPKEKGKSTLSLPENGPSGLQPLQRRSAGDGLLEEVFVRTKDSEAVLASSSEKGRGFRMTAVFEESGSDDEGRLNMIASGSGPTIVPKPSVTGVSMKPATTNGSSVPVAPPPFTTSSVAVDVAVQASGAAAAVDVSKTTSSTQMASSFTFPTRISLEGPPTPKAMSPASTSPKGAPATTPFFSFAANMQGATATAVSVSRAEQTTAAVKADLASETKSEFTFVSASSASLSSSQAFSKVQATSESKMPNLLNQRTPLFGASPSSPLPSSLPTVLSAGATVSTSAPATSAPTGLKFDTSSSASGFTTSVKEGSTPSPFGPAASSFLFGAGAVSAGAAPPSSSVFGSSSGSATSISFGTTAGVTFGQSISAAGSPALTPPTASVAPDTQEAASKSNGKLPLDEERPQKRSAVASEQDASKRQPSAVSTLTPSFTTFGTSVVSSGPTTAIPVTFGAASGPSSQNMFAASTFGQPPRELQPSAASAPAPSLTPASTPAPSAFLFGPTPSTVAASVPVSSAAEITGTPSFPPFTGSVFGASSGGSTFGVTSASPVSFGAASSTPVFGSTSSKPAFGGFATEAVSQSPSLPVFGSGFSAIPAQSPASTPGFSFGGTSSPAFSFAASGTSSSSGSAFGFGATSSFPFGSKSPPSTAAPSVFGLSSSVPAFGSNGTMASDVVVSDHSNMEDSMAEEPPQIAAGMPAQQSSPFGGQSAASPSSFVFGAQTGAPTGAASPLFAFTSQPSPGGFGANPFAAAGATQPPAGALNFSGGAFNLGASGVSDGRTARKFIKAKRTGSKRGK